ncbi:MAG TPA: outer membrane lipoprotein carrier protein LolA [Stellaceae bacterium]|jgi:outer membrane lipoprotein-sorting protein|nr:outer membrane lipoprotein carrier protein LolA [Stellaceae bacterium]
MPRISALRRLAAVLLLAALAAVPIAALSADGAEAAAAPRAAALSPQDRADAQRVEQYLNGIRSLSARFQQYAADGGTAGGQLIVARPGHMRFEYDKPSPILLLADGTFVVYIDNQLKQVSYLPIGSTPAWFLLRDTISLTDGVTITKFERGPGAIRITLVENKSPENGTLTLTFGDKPLELKQWTIVDQQGKSTTVVLSDPRYGVPVDAKAFTFVDPRDKGPRDVH